MKENKLKSRKEWKNIINSIKWDDFQNLIYELLGASGFEGIKQRGSGSDGGRDLEATYKYTRPDGEERIVKCWLQCKKQNRGVAFGQIHEDITRASTNKIDEYYIISNYDTTPDCKDEIKQGEKSWFCRIIDWTGLKLQDTLFSNPDICKYYFPDEEIPSLVNLKKPFLAIQQSKDLGKRFGIELQIKTNKKTNLNNPQEVANIIKDALVNLKEIDINIKALLYGKISLFFFSLERIEDALMFLNKSLDITPKNIEALLNKGFILEKIDKLEDSNKCYNIILELDQNNKFALNNKAHNLRREGKNLEEALSLVNKSLKEDPNFIVAIQTKVDILKLLNKTEEALNFLEEKKELIEKSSTLQHTKVDLYIELLDLKKAFKLNEELLKKYPKDINLINNKGVIYEKNSKYQHPEKYLKLALESFNSVIKENQNYPLGWSNKTVVYINFGKLDKAEEVIDLAYTFFPKHPYILNKKGVILRVKNNPKEALKYFDKALGLYYQEEFLINRAKTHLSLRQWNKAISDVDKILKNNKKNSDAWMIKAEGSHHLHQPTKAKIYVKKAKEFIKQPKSLLE